MIALFNMSRLRRTFHLTAFAFACATMCSVMYATAVSAAEPSSARGRRAPGAVNSPRIADGRDVRTLRPQQHTTRYLCRKCNRMHFELDYWIVSSRHCRQDDASRYVPCELEYFHVGAGSKLTQQSRGDFRNWIRPEVPVCIVVHGSFTSRRSIRYESESVYRWLRDAEPDRPIQIVFFTWPSEGMTVLLPQIDLLLLGRRGEYNGFYLTQLIQDVPSENPLTLYAHSHGARTASTAVHLLGGGTYQRTGYRGLVRPERRIRLVTVAAALDHNWYSPGERYDRTLPKVESILNLRNSRDGVLALYPWRRPGTTDSLGRAGFTMQDLARAGNYAGKLHQIDVTQMIGTDHEWSAYYQRPELAARIAPYIYYADDPTTEPVAPMYAPQTSPLVEPGEGFDRQVEPLPQPYEQPATPYQPPLTIPPLDESHEVEPFDDGFPDDEEPPLTFPPGEGEFGPAGSTSTGPPIPIKALDTTAQRTGRK